MVLFVWNIHHDISGDYAEQIYNKEKNWWYHFDTPDLLSGKGSLSYLHNLDKTTSGGYSTSTYQSSYPVGDDDSAPVRNYIQFRLSS
jgi:hypothetical protein